MPTLALMLFTSFNAWDGMQQFPQAKDDFFYLYEVCEGRPYILLVAEYWLFENPFIIDRDIIVGKDGRERVIVNPWRKYTPAEYGDINCDGIANFIDYCIALEYYIKI